MDYSSRNCPSCAADNGFPNVRLCNSTNEISALTSRYNEALEDAKKNSVETVFKQFETKIETESNVIIAMPINVAKSFFDNPRLIYANYDSLVGNTRLSASFENDTKRRAIDSLLFGNFAKIIHFGALSINDFGLSSYGEVQCILNSSFIKNRTTFLECNSFELFASGNPDGVKTNFLLGRRACWDDRGKLAAIKCGPKLTSTTIESDFTSILLSSASTRSDDDFIEAHIYDTFTVKSIESISLHPNSKLTRRDNLDWRILSEDFHKEKVHS